MKQRNERLRKFLYLLPRMLLVLLLLICTALVVLGSFDQFESYLPLRAARMAQRQITEHLTIGPYPHEKELRRLKRERYTLIISLLDSRLPQERALLRLEQRMANKLGMTLISIPAGYLPLETPENQAAARQAGHILIGRSGSRTYMHCYLGRHRVEYVKRELIRQGIVQEQRGKQR